MRTILDKYTIVQLKLRGHSNREIERMTGHNSKTVVRYWSLAIHAISALEVAFADELTLILQLLIDSKIDAYVDAISHKFVTASMKQKIETTIGGANKTISFWMNVFFLYLVSIARYSDSPGRLISTCSTGRACTTG